MPRDPFSPPPFYRQRTEAEKLAPDRYIATVPVSQVLDSDVTLFTVPDGKLFHVQHAAVENNVAGNLAITVYIVPDGGSAGPTNRIYNAHVVSSNTEETLDALIGTMLEPGEQIIADTDDASTGGNFWLWGYVIDTGTL